MRSRTTSFRWLTASALLLVMVLAGCAQSATSGQSSDTPPPSPTATSTPTPPPSPTPSPTPDAAQFGVYLVAGSGSKPPAVAYGFRASDGAVLWQRTLDITASTPAVANGVLYTVVAHQVGGSLEAIRARDGAVLWQVAYDTYASFIANADGVLYLTTPSETFDAYSASNGKHLWSHTFPHCAGQTVAAGGGAVFVAPTATQPGDGCDTRLTALRASDGSVLWQTKTTVATGASQYALALAGNILYLSAPHTLYALHTGDGSVTWQQPITTGTGGGPILVDGATLYTEMRSGQNVLVLSLDAATGATQWSHQIAPLSYPPVFALADGNLYVPVQNGPQLGGYLLALRASDGTALWKAQLPGQFTTPGAGGDMAFIADWPGSPALPPIFTLYAFHASNGSTAWKHQVSGGSYQVFVEPRA